MALYEQNAENGMFAWESHGGNAPADFADRRPVIDGKTKGDILCLSQKRRYSITLTASGMHLRRHDLTLVCPTLAENGQYAPMLSSALRDDLKIARYEHWRRHNRSGLNSKFRGSAVRSMIWRNGQPIGVRRSLQVWKAAISDSFGSGAKGEMIYHAAV